MTIRTTRRFRNLTLVLVFLLIFSSFEAKKTSWDTPKIREDVFSRSSPVYYERESVFLPLS